jgi:RNA polymerase sigma factor (TIGR02999 family)
MAVSSSGITGLLRAWSEGDDQALSRLTGLVYEELYRLARYYMSGQRPDHILQSTALINEIYLQLNKLQKTDWQSRSHFFGVCSQLMRQTLTRYARSQLYLKRGGNMELLELDESVQLPASEMRKELVALDDALRQLAIQDERKSRIVQLRFYGGFSVKEIAEALNLSERTVKKDWHFAKSWLLCELENGKSNGRKPLADSGRVV